MTSYDLEQIARCLVEPGDREGDIGDRPVSKQLFQCASVLAELTCVTRDRGVPRHRHLETCDVFFGIAGEATVRMWEDGTPVNHALVPGTMILVPARTSHSVVCAAEGGTYVLLQVPGGDDDIEFESESGD